MTDRARPAMIVLARESRGLSQTELAHRLSISPAMMSRIESGVRAVTEKILDQLVTALDYPAQFFIQDDAVIGFGTGELFHRKRQDLSNRTLDKIHARINIRRMHLKRLLRSVEMPPVAVPSFDIDEFNGNASDIARMVRAAWQLPHGPIENVVEVVETAGCFIIPFDFESSRIEAISQWPPDMPPLIFLNTASPTDRVRLTLVHELAHLVMHQQSPNPDMERQAFEFAAEFLMPESEVTPDLRALSLARLAMLKHHWRVSMAALLRRGAELGTITERQARTLWMKMGAAGYRSREPAELDLTAEPPSLYPELLAVFKKDFKYSAAELADVVVLHEHEASSTYYRDPPPHLRVVG